MARKAKAEFGIGSMAYKEEPAQTQGNDYTAQIEAVRADTSLDPAEKKKQLRKLRKLIRKSAGYQRQPRAASNPDQPRKVKGTPLPTISFDDLFKACKELVAKKKLKNVSSKEEAGMGFSLTLSAKEGVTNPETFLEKYKARWGKYPTQYDFIQLPKETLFLLGPVLKGDVQ